MIKKGQNFEFFWKFEISKIIISYIGNFFASYFYNLKFHGGFFFLIIWNYYDIFFESTF
jgi:hypothetical protein